MKRSLLVAVAVAVLTPVATAAANTYDVYSCWAGAGTFHNPNVSSAAWFKDHSHEGGRFAVADDCGTNTNSGAMSIVSMSGYSAANGQYGELAFTAPAGTTIAGASLWRRAWTYGTGSGGSSQRNSLTMLTDDSPFVSEANGWSDVPYGSLGTGDTTNHGIASSNLKTINLTSRNPAKFSYRVGCEIAAGCPTASPSGPYPNYFASGLEIFGAIVSVNDTAAPIIQVADTGLFGGGTVSGTAPVLVQAANDQSGIKKISVFADGAAQVGVLDYEQDLNKCNWASVVPCQDVTDTEIPVDTTRLADGIHSIVVKAFDAADNEKASTTHYITVKNQAVEQPSPLPPSTPSSPASGDSGGLPNGITSDGATGATAATGNPTLTVRFARNGTSHLKAKFGGPVTITGHLRDAAGASIGDAQIDFSSVSARVGSRAQDLGAVRSGADGAFSLKVATKLGSRQLRFAYRPQIGGPVATSAQLQLDVAAPLKLKVTPKRTQNKRVIRFSGRLLAGPIPRRGKVINLQVVVDGHWHTFATVRTSRTGRFRFRYRFMRTFSRVTYRFRARSRYEAAYPFVAGTSASVRVRVN